MPRSETVASVDSERTREEVGGPPTLSDPGRPIRGAVLAGKYRLELLLGEGGMAVVWSAYHLELEIPVAVKLLRGRRTPHSVERLRLEARAAARLVHPAIVRVLDVATADASDPFIVMELLNGETLTALLAREHPSALSVVQLLLPIADALATAHERGVVHRDLKPDNVFLAMEGQSLQPKLLDFGIARLSGEDLDVPRLTDQNVALGSPTYMSPEQARGETVDFKSDIWSFCVLLYKAIGGKAPFRGHDARTILDAVLTEEAPPLPLGAGVDGHLARIVHAGLSKDPSARPASMRLLGQQLARWLLLHGIHEDVCGTPLLSKWLTSEPPTERGMREPPAAARRSMRPPEPSPNPASAPPPVAKSSEAWKKTCQRGLREGHEPRLQVASELTAPSLHVQRAHGVVQLLSRCVPPRNRRWVLWALAGTLVAGASLALTRHDRPAEPLASREPAKAASVAERVLDLDEPATEPAVAVAAVTATNLAAATESVEARASEAAPSSALRRPRAQPRSRAKLPF